MCENVFHKCKWFSAYFYLSLCCFLVIQREQPLPPTWISPNHEHYYSITMDCVAMPPIICQGYVQGYNVYKKSRSINFPSYTTFTIEFITTIVININLNEHHHYDITPILFPQELCFCLISFPHSSYTISMPCN